MKDASKPSTNSPSKLNADLAPNMSRWNNFIAAIFVIIVLCCFFVFISVNTVQQNTSTFVEFAQNSKPSDIKKIEIQKTDPYGDGIGEIIIITDMNSISEFTSALKTIEANPQSYRSGLGNFRRVKIWRTQNRTVEFTCYTVESQGKTVFVNSVLIEPSIYSFGNGEVEFMTPDFYDWLSKYSFSMQ